MKSAFNFIVLALCIFAGNQAVADNLESSKAGLTSVEKNVKAFLPKGYKIVEEIYGDLNKDGVSDRVLIIKNTDKKNFVNHEYRGELDRNRRGIIILFKKGNSYELALKNKNCFSSENEDGGVYFSPDLSVSIQKNKLYIHYGHGRYGFWKYTFRYQNNDFELIGFDRSEDRGPVVERETSINFLTKKKKIRVNTNESAEGGDEIFEETVESVKVERLLKLSEIADFDELILED